MPKVSVVIPVYNVESFLRKAMESVLSQSLKDIEVICVDDGSTDNSGAICDEYARMDNRVKVLHQANSGYGRAVNAGIDLACSDYLAIFESDDLITPNMYEVLSDAMDRHGLDFVKSDFYHLYESNDCQQLIQIPLTSDLNYYNRIVDVQNDLNVLRFQKYTWSGLYRLDFLKSNGIRHNETPGASYQDNGFWFQTFMFAKKVMFIDKPFYMYRQDNPNSSVKSKGKVYAVRDEFDFIRKLIVSRLQNETVWLHWASYFRFQDYIGNLDRIDDKFRLEFIRFIREEFMRYKESREVGEHLFNSRQLEVLYDIVESPELFYSKLREDEGKIQRAISPFDRLIIYGAGQYGRWAFNYLSKYQFEHKVTFAVSNKPESDYHFGRPFKSLNDCKAFADSSLVIIAVKEESEHFFQMQSQARTLGFRDVVSFNQLII